MTANREHHSLQPGTQWWWLFVGGAYSRLSWECAAHRSAKAGPLLPVEIPLEARGWEPLE